LLLDDGGRTFRQFLHDFVSVAKHIEYGREEFGKALGVTAAEYSIIMLIAQRQAEGGMTPIEISRLLHLHNPYVILHLGKLVQRGILERHPHPDDGRSVLFALTPVGEQLVDRVTPLVRLANDAFFRSLSTEDMQELSRVFSGLARDADTAFRAIQLHRTRQDLDSTEIATDATSKRRRPRFRDIDTKDAAKGGTEKRKKRSGTRTKVDG
jgi:MarR family transcriptional regulator, organic hydroperoxide resistance regulator